MSNYSGNEDSVRVDIWKESGKWYTTLELKWDRYLVKEGGTRELMHDTFKRCLREQHENCYIGMTATCLDPYHEYSHPLMISRISKNE